jgi:hypothetical protein
MWRLLVSKIEITRCLTTPMTLEAIGMATRFVYDLIGWLGVLIR